MTTRRHVHLLLVDDDNSLLKLLGMRLTNEGFKMTTAGNGQKALRLLQHGKIDLFISELRMDEMDGIALFKAIQQQPRLPVIILTAHAAILDAVSAIQEGVFNFLTKPWIATRCIAPLKGALALTRPAGAEPLAGCHRHP